MNAENADHCLLSAKISVYLRPICFMSNYILQIDADPILHGGGDLCELPYQIFDQLRIEWHLVQSFVHAPQPLVSLLLANRKRHVTLA